eukprot:3805702-Pyramimonas_sp.AAC.1
MPFWRSYGRLLAAVWPSGPSSPRRAARGAGAGAGAAAGRVSWSPPRWPALSKVAFSVTCPPTVR